MKRKIKLTRCTANGTRTADIILFTDSIESLEGSPNEQTKVTTKSGKEFFVIENINKIDHNLDYTS